ncbi:hypothetical protein LOZ58_004712 [Ophidiomyces ophidiicola]|nr:hypothetical protein LOZ58_004712 [Ophidiomyces ophidiicola]
MRVSYPLLSQLEWLSSLKAAQLHKVAFLTGTASSGGKAVVSDRLANAFATANAEMQPSSKKDGPLSILSIDMGIRNLAYAHLLVEPEINKSGRAKSKAFKSPILNAWNRLVISDFPDPSCQPSGILSSPGRSTSNKRKPRSEDEDTNEAILKKESFAPDLYAAHAYTLIKSLISTYQPTHFLIERQRFRSGGASAVQEWSIRVGVFEGMLHAILYALRQESNTLDFKVQSVEPRRVVDYWIQTDPGAEAPEAGGKRKKVTSMEGKKAKVGIAGRWIAAALLDRGGEDAKLDLSTNTQVMAMSSAFLKKWGRGRNKDEIALVTKALLEASSVAKSEEKYDSHHDTRPDIGKVDDLADCLLQGIAWLEWHAWRRRFNAEGPDAMPQAAVGG